MPWKPRYTKEDAEVAVARSRSWSEVLIFLGLSPRGKNYTTIRKWTTAWEIDTAHLPAYAPRRAAPKFSQQQLRDAVATARSWSEALRNLGMCPTGGNWRTIKKWAERWGIDSSHFDPHAAATEALRGHQHRAKPLEEILVENSTFSRSSLKRRLYAEGLRQPVCQLCGQDENWRGKRIAMILDHINGVRNDNRLCNLRIVCPNCAAGLDTHCGRSRSGPSLKVDRACLRCGKAFQPKYRDHRYCSRECGTRATSKRLARPDARRVERPPLDELLDEVRRLGFCAVGRKYGVSDNAIRKWIRTEEARSRSDRDGDDPRPLPGFESAEPG